MHGTTAQRHCRTNVENVPYTHRPYWGWSHRNQRMEFMDLPSYMDSFQQGYDTAFGDLLARMQAAGPAATSQSPAAPWPGPAASWPGQAQAWLGHHEQGHHEQGHHEQGHHEHGHHEHGHHEHGHHEHEGYRGGYRGREQRDCGCGDRRDRDCGCGDRRDRDCGCGDRRDRDCGCGDRRDRDCGCGQHREWDGCADHDCRGCSWRRERDCRCDCCIVDADIIVYAHCGEIRVVPIEVSNDTRKIRENVDVQVSDVRSSGGRVLAWPTLIRPEGPLTLQPCSTTRLELLVQVVCGDQRDKATAAASGETAKASTAASGKARAASSDTGPGSLATLAPKGEAPTDVDQCEVGYTTIRLDGCLVRPIVVAIAALPLVCDSYRTGCSCSCCC